MLFFWHMLWCAGENFSGRESRRRSSTSRWFSEGRVAYHSVHGPYMLPVADGRHGRGVAQNCRPRPTPTTYWQHLIYCNHFTEFREMGNKLGKYWEMDCEILRDIERSIFLWTCVHEMCVHSKPTSLRPHTHTTRSHSQCGWYVHFTKTDVSNVGVSSIIVNLTKQLLLYRVMLDEMDVSINHTIKLIFKCWSVKV